MGRLSRGACTPPDCSGLRPSPTGPGDPSRRAPRDPASRRLHLDMVASEHCLASAVAPVRSLHHGLHMQEARSTLLSLLHAGPDLHTNASLTMHQAPHCCMPKVGTGLLICRFVQQVADVARLPDSGLARHLQTRQFLGSCGRFWQWGALLGDCASCAYALTASVTHASLALCMLPWPGAHL